MKHVPKELAALFGPSVQPYLISLLNPEPTAERVHLTCPALVVSEAPRAGDGGGLQPARGGQEGGEGGAHRGMNRSLQEVKPNAPVADPPGGLDPERPLHPKLSEELVGLFKAAFAGK